MKINKKNDIEMKPVNGFDLSDLAVEKHNDVKMAKVKKTLREEIQDHIRIVEDFPKKGISFKDITTFVNNHKLFQDYINALSHRYANYNIEYIVGIESRGFIFGAALSFSLGAGFVPVRKKGKLPYKVASQKYELEYGTDELQIHEDAFHGLKGARVILIDDLLATGGTAFAALQLLKKIEAKCIEFCTLISLKEFEKSKDREKLQKEVSVFSLIEYEK